MPLTYSAPASDCGMRDLVYEAFSKQIYNVMKRERGREGQRNKPDHPHQEILDPPLHSSEVGKRAATAWLNI